MTKFLRNIADSEFTIFMLLMVFVILGVLGNYACSRAFCDEPVWSGKLGWTCIGAK